MGRFARYLLTVLGVACCIIVLLKTTSFPIDTRSCKELASAIGSVGEGGLQRVVVQNVTKYIQYVPANTINKTGKCRVIDINTPAKGEFYCTKLSVSPNPHLCVYKNKADDVWVSGAIHNGGVWESGNVRLLMDLLQKDPGLGLLDIGANFGQYTMLAAGLGRPVLAVEALDRHIEMQKRAVELNHFQDRIVIVHNAVSDVYDMVSLATHKGNMGSTHVVVGNKLANTFYAPNKVPTILMDDLAEVIPFQRGIMKIDIEGHEGRAMAHSDAMFRKVYFPYVLMEWSGSKSKAGTEELKLVENMLHMMLNRGYQAYTPGGNQPLDSNNWKKWPFDIFWKHALVK